MQQWAIYVSERNKEKLPIYLYGQSMGAAAVLMASGHTLPAEVKGLIADCGFQSMEGQMRDMAANWFHLHHIPLLLIELDWFCSLLAGFHMKDADTAEAMKKIQDRFSFSMERRTPMCIQITLFRIICSAGQRRNW